jgi:hypothetical protein
MYAQWRSVEDYQAMRRQVLCPICSGRWPYQVRAQCEVFETFTASRQRLTRSCSGRPYVHRLGQAVRLKFSLLTCLALFVQWVAPLKLGPATHDFTPKFQQTPKKQPEFKSKDQDQGHSKWHSACSRSIRK